MRCGGGKRAGRGRSSAAHQQHACAAVARYEAGCVLRLPAGELGRQARTCRGCRAAGRRTFLAAPSAASSAPRLPLAAPSGAARCASSSCCRYASRSRISRAMTLRAQPASPDRQTANHGDAYAWRRGATGGGADRSAAELAAACPCPPPSPAPPSAGTPGHSTAQPSAARHDMHAEGPAPAQTHTQHRHLQAASCW